MRVCEACGYALDVRRVAWMVEGRLEGELDLCGHCRLEVLDGLEALGVKRLRAGVTA